MSNDWDKGNPFAPDEERHPHFFDRAAKYIVSSGAVPPEDEGVEGQPAQQPSSAGPEPQDWDQPRSVLPDTPPVPTAGPAEPEPAGEETDPEPLYTDDHGVPMLFDVVILGDDCRAAGLFLPRNPQRPARPAAAEPTPRPLEEPPPVLRPGPSVEEIEARIQQAIDNALPHVTEVAASLLRDSLSEEIHRALQHTRDE